MILEGTNQWKIILEMEGDRNKLLGQIVERQMMILMMMMMTKQK